jgi:hypothetical protein
LPLRVACRRGEDEIINLIIIHYKEGRMFGKSGNCIEEGATVENQRRDCTFKST